MHVVSQTTHLLLRSGSPRGYPAYLTLKSTVMLCYVTTSLRYICGRGFLGADLIHKSHNAAVPYPTMHHSEQKCAHFCSEWCIVGYGTGALWDLWDWSIAVSGARLSSVDGLVVRRIKMHHHMHHHVKSAITICLQFISNMFTIYTSIPTHRGSAPVFYPQKAPSRGSYVNWINFNPSMDK